MRHITDHKVNGLNEALAVVALDNPGPGGCSHGAARWQNAAWVAEIVSPKNLEDVRTDLRIIARQFRQDSIALTTGNTEFVSP